MYFDKIIAALVSRSDFFQKQNKKFCFISLIIFRIFGVRLSCQAESRLLVQVWRHPAWDQAAWSQHRTSFRTVSFGSAPFRTWKHLVLRICWSLPLGSNFKMHYNYIILRSFNKVFVKMILICVAYRDLQRLGELQTELAGSADFCATYLHCQLLLTKVNTDIIPC